MNANRIFICHVVSSNNQRDVQILNYLIQALQGAGIEVIIDRGDSTESSFLQFLQQELPICGALILFQTPDALHSSQISFAVNLAQKQVEQKSMQNIFRFISTSDNTDVVPPRWKTLTTFDGTRDYMRAVEKLLLATSTNVPLDKPGQIAIKAAPPPARVSFPKVAPPRTNYDRPVLPPSRLKILADQFPNRTNPQNKRRMLLVRMLIILILITVVGSAAVIGLLFLNSHPTVTPPIIRQAYFFSSNQMGTPDTTIGTCDSVQLNLQDITSPAAGNSYYAWLLPDLSNQEGATVALGRLTINQGTALLAYTDPKHQNLLQTESRFLVTEESSNSSPSAPSPNQHLWRYYGVIPQTPNQKDPHHYSDLDHIRHLLTQEPMLQQHAMRGGLNIWFYQAMQQLFQSSNTAQALLQQQKGAQFHQTIVRILVYLDGPKYIYSTGDVPQETPLDADVQNLPVPLLTFDPITQDPSGYIYHIQTHMQGITNSPGATDAQQAFAGKIDTELNKINIFLGKVRQDAKKLAAVPEDQLTNVATTATMNDLTNNVASAFIGQLNTNTGTRQGGATWIHDNMPQIATFNIQPYPSTAH